MKKLILLFFLLPTICLSQEVLLPNIAIPGETSKQFINAVVLGENIVGPSTVFFSVNSLQKEKKKKNSISNLTTLYSGSIYSPGIIEPFVFKDKTPEELNLLEAQIFPLMLEMPYTLFIDIKIVVYSKSIDSKDLDEAGHYTAKIKVHLINGLTNKK